MQMHVILMTVGIVVWFSSLASAQTVDAGVSRWSGELDDGIVGEAYAVHVSGRLPVCCDTPRPRIRLYAGFNAYPQDDGIVWDRLGGVSVRLSPPGWSVRTYLRAGVLSDPNYLYRTAGASVEVGGRAGARLTMDVAESLSPADQIAVVVSMGVFYSFR